MGEHCWARAYSWFKEYSLQRSKSMQADTTEEEELNQQHRMKTMTDMKSEIKAKGRMGANISCWVSVLRAADCKKAWLLPEWEDTVHRGTFVPYQKLPLHATRGYTSTLSAVFASHFCFCLFSRKLLLTSCSTQPCLTTSFSQLIASIFLLLFCLLSQAVSANPTFCSTIKRRQIQLPILPRFHLLFTLLFLSSLFYPFSCPPPFSKFDLVRSLHHVHQLYPLHLLFLLFLFQFPLFVSSSSSSSSSSFPFFLPSFRDLSHSRSYFSSCCLSSDCSPCKVCITIFPLCHHFLHRTQVEGVLGPSPWLFSFKSSRVFHDSEDTVDSVCTEQTTYFIATRDKAPITCSALNILMLFIVQGDTALNQAVR